MIATRHNRLLLACGCICAVASSPDVTQSGEPNHPVAPSRVEYRRVFAPEDAIGQWPTGKARYLWIDRDEFQRLEKIVNDASGGRPVSAALVQRARYRARHDGRQILSGTGMLDVELKSSTTALLPLGHCGLSMVRPRWEDSDDGRAILGLAPTGQLVLLADRTGKLGFDWTLRGAPDAFGAMSFELVLPTCPIIDIELALPESVMPVVSRGVVGRPTPMDDGGEDRRDTSAGANHIDNSKWSRWPIQLGGHSHVELRIVPNQPVEAFSRLVLMRKSSTYEISQKGLELSAEFLLDVHDEPLKKVPLELDAGLQLTAAQLGETPVVWSTREIGDSGTAQAVLTMPESVAGTSRLLRVTGVAPVQLDRSWRLPAIHVQGMFWQEEIATLRVLDPLLLSGLTTDGCRQSKPVSGTTARGGESFVFQLFRPDAGIETVVKRPRPRVEMISGTTLQLDANSISGRMVSDFSCVRGEVFELIADAPADWIIDSVESVPATALDDWQVQVSGANLQRLAIRLNSSLRPENNVRLEITGHYPHVSADAGFRPAEFGLARFLNVLPGEQLMVVRAEAPKQLKWTAHSPLNRRDVRSLDEDLAELVDAQPGDLLFDLDGAAEHLRVSLVEDPPGFATQIDVQAVVRNDTLNESYTIRCIPDSNYVGRISVHFSAARKSPLRWNIDSESGVELTAVRFAEDAKRATATRGRGEIWELTLRPPRKIPFELRATRDSALMEEMPVSLVSVLDASSERATLTIRSVEESAFRVHNRRLKSIHPNPHHADRYPTARACYEYDPSHHVLAAAEPAVTVSPTIQNRQPMAWAWSCVLESRFAQSGQTRHTATYRVENSGRDEIRLSLDPDVQLRRVMLDNGQVSVTPQAGSARQIVIPLPSGIRFATLVVEFDIPSGPLGRIQTLSATAPIIDIPILTSQWRVWVPSVYQPLRDISSADSEVPETTWCQRLFGPFHRPVSEQPFGVANRSASSLPARKAGLVVPATRSTSPHSPAARLWSNSSSEMMPKKSLDGWSVYLLLLSPEMSNRFIVYRRTDVELLGWVFFFLAAASLWWLTMRYPFCWPVALTVSVAIALLVPVAVVPVTSAVVLGVLAAGMLYCLTFWPLRTHSELSNDSGDFIVAAPRQILGLILFIVLATCAATALAEDANESGDRSASSSIPPVFIPVDEDRNPTGKRYYVPEALYQDLYQLAQVAQSAPRDWLICTATYRGVLDQAMPETDLRLIELTGTYQINVFGSRQDVRIPLSRSEVEIPNGEAKLDGRPLRVVWNADGDSLICSIDQPGSYQLELPIQPVEAAYDSTGLDFSIPRLPISKLHLMVPTDGPSVEIRTAIGRITSDHEVGSIAADLGPTDRLSFDWKQTIGSSDTMSEAEVDELLWLKIRPGSVVLEGSFQFRRAGILNRVLRLTADSRLRMLPVSNEHVSDPTVIRSDEGQIFQYRVDEGVADPISVRARFLLTGTSGIGNLRLPKLEADGRSMKRWLAVSVDAGLNFEEVTAEKLVPLSIPEFTGAWNGAEGEPQLAYESVPRGDIRWSIATRPREPTISADQTLTLKFFRDHSEFEFIADLDIDGGSVFQHVLSGTKGLRIDQVTVRADDHEQPVRWADDGLGTGTLFLTSPISGPHQLTVRGDLVDHGRDSLTMPQLRLSGAQTERNRFQVFRAPGVSVEYELGKGLAAAEFPTKDDWQIGASQLVGTWQATNEDIDMQFRFLRSVPRVRADQVIRLLHEDDKWFAEMDFRIEVERGVVDQLQFLVPQDWNPDMALSPPLRYVLSDAPGENRRELVIALPYPVDGEFRIRVRAPVSPSANQRIRVPDIFPLDIGRSRRFVVLPTHIDRQPVDWETLWLQAAPLPAEFQPPRDAAARLASFRIIRDRFVGELRSIEQVAGVPQVRLEDHHVSWCENGDCFGVSTFDLEPAGLTECELQLPKGFEVVHARVAGLPARLDLLDDRRYRVALGPDQLPQRLEFIFVGQMDETRWIHAPTLVDLPVQRSLWTLRRKTGVASIFGLSRNGVGKALARNENRSRFSDNQMHGARQELFRLKTMTALVDLASHVVAEQSPEELSRWYLPWAQRIVESQRHIDRYRDQDPIAAGVDRPELQAIEREQLEIAEHLNTVAVHKRTREQYVPLPTLAKLWYAVTETQGPVNHYAFPGTVDSTFVGRAAVFPLEIVVRTLVVVLIAIAAVVIWRRGWLSGVVVEWVTRWPLASGAILAIFWWMFLIPSILGLAAALLILGVAIRQNWRFAVPRLSRRSVFLPGQPRS